MVKHEDILAALNARTTWETRQETWYSMRHDGLRRKAKPFPNAADMHFPLGDTFIDKLKPYYVQQVFASDTLATFLSLKQEMSEYSAGSGQWFDYQLKQKSNFEFEIVTAIDAMLLSGKNVIKVYWDADHKELRYDSVDPLHLIVPPWTQRIENADWIVHVMELSKAAYALRKEYKQDPEFLASIAGKQGESSAQQQQAKYVREGINKPTGDDMIIVWEVMSRTDAGKWEVETYSPAQPTSPIRAKFQMPYTEGAFGRGMPPYAEINAEIKDKGFYAARGVMEKIAPFEASLCKDWNTQKDYQTLTCNPVFSGKGVPDGMNLRMIPGQILPYDIQAVTFPPMPMDLQQQMNGTRIVAEQVVQMPDFGAAQPVNTSKARTATEMSMAGQMAAQSTDLRARIFRRELGHLFQLSWSLLIQYKKKDLAYYYREDLLALDAKALNDAYQIEPSGSGDNLNKPLMMQKAVGRFQMFNNDPMIEQRELRRSVLEADDPRLVKRLLLDQGTQQAMQLEDQAQEISILLINFPAQVKPTDTDSIHLQALTGFAQRKLQMGEALQPEQWLMLATHALGHIAQWKKKNPQEFGQQGAQYAQFWQQAQQNAQKMQQQVMAQQQAQMQPAPQDAAMGGAQ